MSDAGRLEAAIQQDGLALRLADDLRDFLAGFSPAWTGRAVKGRPALDRADLLAAWDEFIADWWESRRFLAEAVER